MRSFIFLLIILTTLPVFTQKKKEHLKSRVYFYKNVSEEDIEGWERDFFKDHFEDEPISIPDADIVADRENDDKDIVRIKRVPKIRRLPKIRKILSPQPVKEVPDNEPELFPPDTEKEEKDTYGEPVAKVRPVEKKKKTVSLSDIIPETGDEDTETPDNEVDRSSRIRKMKKLLKKRKGKRRIDKRF